MELFARMFVSIADWLPVDYKFRWEFQRTLYVSCKRKVVAWHHAQLKKLDGIDFMERFTRLAALEKTRKEKGIGIILDGALVARIKD